MAKSKKKAWLRQVLTGSAQAGFRRAYEQVRIDETKFLRYVQRAHKLPIRSWDEMFYLGPEVIDPIAARTILGASKMAALEGMGLGIAGFLGAIPDMGILAAITLRMLQKLSLLYGFEYVTDEETVALWIAAASAAGVDLGKDLLEKQAMERVVPKLVDQVAVKVGSEVAEKWAGRIVPVIGAGVSGAINYYFVRSWGRRAQQHFLDRHCRILAQSHQARLRASSSSSLSPGPILPPAPETSS
ncbi:MAG TPA: EcsC family protein [Candidatus Aquilonibacter sp.]|nr:EcsC family protein [Candidatus Aquilonibacter sp.]